MVTNPVKNTELVVQVSLPVATGNGGRRPKGRRLAAGFVFVSRLMPKGGNMAQGSNNQNNAVAGWMALFFLAAVCWLVLHLFSGSSSSGSYEVSPSNGTPTTDANEWANDGAAWVVNPADLHIDAVVKNTGGTAATPDCDVHAADNSGAYSGTDVVTDSSSLNPGETWDFSDDLTITNQGANYVTQITVNCQNG
jgi:hypothetical protein